MSYDLCFMNYVLLYNNYASPLNGKNIVFSSVVCPSVRPSVCLFVRHTFVSALYLLNPLWELKITLHICQAWCDDVQCVCLTKVGSRSRSYSLRFNIVWLYLVSVLYLLNTWWDLQITLHKCEVWLIDVRCICLIKVKVIVQGFTLYDCYLSAL